MVKFKIEGTHEGEKIESEVEAVSIKQAKFKAGLDCGYGGKNMSKFMNDSKIKVRRIRE